ncbi:VOC family protein [Rhizobium halophilum]|uniref:VOC family protein n=1 Tax=Rhizobium halophilum TaxID=2846852 RepID=UPI001EFDAF24|nr:VOC family protein [Rhizobium halophilum]MCF6367568.1 VOC family protein [Rhizobium halophilum]
MNMIQSSKTGIGKVTLTVNDLDRVSGFYQEAVGLHLLRGDASTVELGVDGDTLLELRRDTAARRRSPREAGLFHTAFLLPSRADLGRWIKHAMKSKAPVVGASDHGVSEALYLSDPEGNGVEIYADRPVLSWQWKDGLVDMPSDPLDIDALVDASGGEEWNGFPEGATVGHVHLQVGAIPTAEAFYRDVLGFAVTSRYPGGTFYAADGYHHHLATNIWNSQGAGARTFPSTGLANVEIVSSRDFVEAVGARADHTRQERDTLTLVDPWGTEITVATATQKNIKE